MIFASRNEDFPSTRCLNQKDTQPLYDLPVGATGCLKQEGHRSYMLPIVSQKSKNETLEQVKYHYDRTSSKPEISRLISALCTACGWGRKYAIKRLRRAGGVRPAKGPHGGPRIKYDEEVAALLKNLWMASDQLCGRRLVPVLFYWLSSWEKRHGALSAEVRRKILEISPAQADRLLRPFKIGPRRAVRLANEVLRQIPLRTGPWAEVQPGWIEADTVAHCGGSLKGSHGWSVVATDIATGWTEARMSWNRNEHNVFARLREIESALPFGIIGFDTDNGGEFINTTLHRYWRDRPVPIEVTRSRPYRKNDNAHIEQKNLVLIRENLGYERIGEQTAIASFNEALKLLSLRANLYQANLKLVSKEHGEDRTKKPRKKYEKTAQTSWQRLQANAQITAEQKQRLEKLQAENDPMELNDRIQAKLKEAWESNTRKANEGEAKRENRNEIR